MNFDRGASLRSLHPPPAAVATSPRVYLTNAARLFARLRCPKFAFCGGTHPLKLEMMFFLYSPGETELIFLNCFMK